MPDLAPKTSLDYLDDLVDPSSRKYDGRNQYVLQTVCDAVMAQVAKLVYLISVHRGSAQRMVTISRFSHKYLNTMLNLLETSSTACRLLVAWQQPVPRRPHNPHARHGTGILRRRTGVYCGTVYHSVGPRRLGRRENDLLQRFSYTAPSRAHFTHNEQ